MFTYIMLERVIFMNNQMYRPRPPRPNGGQDRFIFPFLTGALVGGAAVGLTRPRPIVNAAPQGPIYGPRPPYPAPYSYYSYGGFVPGPYGY